MTENLSNSTSDGFEDRHPATRDLLRYFEYAHLHEDLQPVSRSCAHLAIAMAKKLPDGPELDTGLRKLLEAKDCFVRAALETAATPNSSNDR